MEMSDTFKSIIKSDLNRYVNTNSFGILKKCWFFTKCLIMYDTFSVLFWWRLMKYLETKNFVAKVFNILVKFIFFIKRRQTGIQIPKKCSLGRGIRFCHFSCIVFAEGVRIGDYCSIHQGVTIGRKFAGEQKGVPTIGNNVIVFPGAKVIGNITVGNNVVIGANATVIADVPDNSVVVGTPARVISNDSSRAIDSEWHEFFAW